MSHLPFPLNLPEILTLVYEKGQSLSLMEVDLGFLKTCLMVFSMI